MLNAWLVNGATRRDAVLSKEKKRIELFSQIRALLRVRLARTYEGTQFFTSLLITNTLGGALVLADFRCECANRCTKKAKLVHYTNVSDDHQSAG